MRVLGAAVLSLEAIVVILAIPVVIVVGTVPVPPWLGISAGVVLALALIVLARYVTRPWAIPVGWALQVIVVLTGLLAPAMFIVGGIFALLWGVAIKLGRQVDGASGPDGAAGRDSTAG
jgi:energy-coupling factor transporter transmembrane protein EcfT